MRRDNPAWRRARAAWAPEVAMGRTPCRRCGQLIEAGQAWDLGHPDEAPHREVGSGPEVIAACRPEHMVCSRKANGRRGGNAAGVIAAPPDGGLW